MIWFYLEWNMTDKELLELAAKSAGFNLVFGGLNGDIPRISGYLTSWNPLTDDGDALRLAVKLGLVIDIDYNGCVGVGSASFDEILETAGNDPYTATRRAIVRAAAAIGEKL